MKYIILAIGVLFFGGCTPKFANINTIHSEFKNISFPSPRGLYKYWVPEYRIKYPIYSSKLHSYGYVIISHKSKFVKQVDMENYTNIISKKKGNYILKYIEMKFSIKNNSFISYYGYKVEPDIRKIYNFNFDKNLKLSSEEINSIKQDIVSNENYLIDIVKYGVARGKIIERHKVNMANTNITIIKKIDGIYTYKDKKVLVTYDSNKNGKIECGGYSYLDYKTLQTLFVDDVCYGVINSNNKKFGLKIIIKGEAETI